jgi:uncharacterized C2H2 Zn-finger protein
MIQVEHSGQTESVETVQFCPFCQKLFMQEKPLFKHIVDAHRNCEYMSYSFRADMYARWQERIPRLEQ